MYIGEVVQSSVNDFEVTRFTTGDFVFVVLTGCCFAISHQKCYK